MTDFADDTSTELERKAGQLEWIALTETATYSVLAVFWLSGNTVGTAIMGSLHGMVVLAFAAMAAMISRDMRWSWRYVLLVVATGPIGGILVYERIRREGVPEAHRLATRRR